VNNRFGDATRRWMSFVSIAVRSCHGEMLRDTCLGVVPGKEKTSSRSIFNEEVAHARGERERERERQVCVQWWETLRSPLYYAFKTAVRAVVAAARVFSPRQSKHTFLLLQTWWRETWKAHEKLRPIEAHWSLSMGSRGGSQWEGGSEAERCLIPRLTDEQMSSWEVEDRELSSNSRDDRVAERSITDPLFKSKYWCHTMKVLHSKY